jgi:hypothetical protein
MRTIIASLIILVIVVGGAPARAQSMCLDDAECAPGQACRQQRCVGSAPAPAPLQPYAAPQPYVPQPYVYTPRPASPGISWAGGAGIFGLVSSGVVLGLASASEGTKDQLVPSLPLGVTATVLLAASVPIVAAGGISARREGQVRGILALRVLGWIFYGLSLAEAGGLIALGTMEVTPPDGMIISTGLLGVSSLVMMSADALVSRKQAAERVGSVRRPTVELWPTLSGNGVGMAGRF